MRDELGVHTRPRAEEIFERCWDQRVDPVTRSVAVHLSTLRRKLGAPPLIRTVRGTGYVINAPTN